MSGVKIAGTSGREAEVDLNNQLVATGPLDNTKAGFAVLALERDAGTITGTRYMMTPRTSENHRLRVGMDALLDDERFIYAAQNTGKHKISNTTMTVTYGGGFMTTNGGGITTVTTGILWQTYKHFPLYQMSSLWAEIECAFTNTWVTNTTIDIGFFLAPVALPNAPTDGVYFRVTSAGMQGVTNVNGAEQTSGVFPFTPVLNQVYNFRIVMHDAEVEFWINDVMYAEIARPAAEGNPFRSAVAPFAIRHQIIGGAASAALSVKVAGYAVALQDVGGAKPWREQLAGSGYFGWNPQPGHTNALAQGTNAYYPVSAVPISVTTPTATTIAGPSGLGGLYMTPASALAIGTDYTIMGYQNPVPTSLITGRTFHCTGIGLDTMFNSLAAGSVLSAGGYVMAYALGMGGWSITLNLADASAMKAYRRMPIGFQNFPSGTIAGTVGSPAGLYKPIDPPIPLNPGEWAVVMMKPLNYTTQQGSIWHSIFVNGFWE